MTRTRTRLLAAVDGVGYGDGDALLEQAVKLAVGRGQAHGRTVASQLVHGGVEGRGRQRGVEFDERGAQPIHQHHLATGRATERAAGTESLLQCGDRLPAQRGEKLDGGLFDQVLFGVGVGGHGSSCGGIADKLPINCR